MVEVFILSLFIGYHPNDIKHATERTLGADDCNKRKGEMIAKYNARPEYVDMLKLGQIKLTCDSVMTPVSRDAV